MCARTSLSLSAHSVGVPLHVHWEGAVGGGGVVRRVGST